MKMKPLINLTLHTQGQNEIEIARHAGFDLDPAPTAPLVGAGLGGLEKAAIMIAKILRTAVREGAAVLIGGHTGALVAALRMIKSEEWPEMAILETERVRDENDRFIFVPKGICVIPGGSE